MRKAGQYLAKAHHVHGSQDASADASSLTQTPNMQHSERYADHKAEKTRQSTEQRGKCGHNKSCVSPSHTFSGNDATPLRYVENACCCCCSTNQPATALLSAEQTSTDHVEEPARVPQDAAIDDAHGSKLGACAPSDMFAAYPKQHYFSAATTGRGCRNMSFAATTAEPTIAVPSTKAQIKPDTKTKADTSAAMCYPADAQTYMAGIDSGLGRRHINSIVSTASSGYSWMPAHIPLLDLGMHSAATSAGISQRVLNRAVDSQRKRDRSSRRIRSIAATGASGIATPDGQSHALYLSSDGFAEDSSLDRSDGHKISMVAIGAAPSDPLVAASKPKNNAAKSVRTASGELSGCHGMHESSVVWMHSAYSEKSQGQQGAKTQSDSALAFNETSNNETIQRGVLQGAGTHSGCADTSKYMFYSSRTGAVYGSSLVAPVCGDLGIDSLIDLVLGSDGLEESGNSPSTCFWLDIAGASPQEVADLSDIFELHPLSTQDIVNGCPRDKIDVFATYAFVVYSSILHGDGADGGSSSASSSEYGKSSGGVARWAGEPADPQAGRSRKCNARSGGQICIVMRSNYVVTFHCGHQRPVVRRVLDRLDAMKATLAEGEGRSGDIGPMAARSSDAALSGLVDFPAYIVYAVLDEITDQLSPSLLAIEQH
ncbi:CorA metal ion transporter, partial [Coemansia sp. RSA 486]